MRPLLITMISSLSDQRLGLVVGDVDRGDADLLLDALELDPHLLAQLGSRLESGSSNSRSRGSRHDRARQRRALLLAAGELRGELVGHVFEPDEAQHIGDPLV